MIIFKIDQKIYVGKCILKQREEYLYLNWIFKKKKYHK